MSFRVEAEGPLERAVRRAHAEVAIEDDQALADRLDDVLRVLPRGREPLGGPRLGVDVARGDHGAVDATVQRDVRADRDAMPAPGRVLDGALCRTQVLEDLGDELA